MNNFVLHSTNVYSLSHVAMFFEQWPNKNLYGNYYSIPTSGDYIGANITSNAISCSPAQNCGFGLSIGAGNWYPEPTNVTGGYYSSFSIFDAWLGFSIQNANYATLDEIDVGLSGTYGGVWGPSASPFFSYFPYYAYHCPQIPLYSPEEPNGVKPYNIDPYSNVDIIDYDRIAPYLSRVQMNGCILAD